MPRFYRVVARYGTRLMRGGLLIAALASATRAAAQTAQALPEQPLLGSTLSADLLRDLPTGDSPFAIFETIQPQAIGDLFSSGVLNAATAPKIGGFLGSWTQTQYRVGDVAITDPLAGGTPLLLPQLPLWGRITASAGAMGVDDNASALSMTLEPPRPARTWQRLVEASLSAPALVTGVSGSVPAVDLLHQWQDATVMVSGPLSDRVGLVASGSWRGLSQYAGASKNTTTDQIASGFAHLVFAATPRDEVRVLGWAQYGSSSSFTDTGMHLQSTWERHQTTGATWRIFGGFTARSRTTPAAPALLVVDDLTSDPISDLFDTGAGSARRWTLGARLASSTNRWMPSVGADLEGARVTVAPSGLTQIGERVDTLAARLWTLSGGTTNDGRHMTTVAAFANEHVIYRRLTVDGGLRLDTVDAAADSATQGINWTTLLPRASARFQATERGGVALVAAYRRTAYQLPLNVLAVGDPAAPVADVAMWNGTNAGSLIARVGPGTGSDPSFSRIDPGLQRPTTDELVLAIQAHPAHGVELQLARTTKREKPLMGVIDTGVTDADYTTLQVNDPSFLPGSPVGAPQVPVFNRAPGLYGRDRYLLTNLSDSAKFWGLEATVKISTDTLTLLFGTELTEATGPAAAVGYLPTENDQNVLGSLFVDPNSATQARGQLFQDRSHVAKIAAIYRLPWRTRIGAIVRYQDGQPFARLVIAPALTQGATAVRAYANGGSAFTYTATLDLRLQKTFTVGGSELTAILDVYNLPNLSSEVTEYIVSGPGFRTPTAVQPPRTAMLGIRATF
jgi:hypothetical protein